MSLQVLEERRRERGAEMVAGEPRITQLDPNTYSVPSQSVEGKSYRVVNVGVFVGTAASDVSARKLH